MAVDTVFGGDVDYAMLVKIYGSDPAGEKRYSPTKCLGAKKSPVIGEPDKNHISTSFAERQNLTMRMYMRRFTRLTIAFSKKLENHGHHVALYSMFYNFVRIHQTLKVSPAMAAGVTDKLWEIGDIISMVETWESEYATAGITYRIGENEIAADILSACSRATNRCPIRSADLKRVRRRKLGSRMIGHHTSQGGAGKL